MILCILNIALSFCLSSPLAAAQVQSGLDVISAEGCSSLKNKRVALLVNANSITADGTFIVDVLRRNGVVIKKIFSPEHGLSAELDEKVTDSTFAGIPVISLYGKRRNFIDSDLSDIDTILFDIQDAGARYYTYLATLVYTLRAAQRNNLSVVVLDRPNPVGGTIVSGFVPGTGLSGFYTSIYPVPTRHGMTIGELALYYNLKYKINARLNVVSMKGYDRSMLFSETGLRWRNPSPNLRSEEAALLYAGIGWLETTNLSMARGLPESFEMIGAPYIDAELFARELKKAKGLANVSVEAANFIPTAPGHKYANQPCGGIKITITDKKKFDGFELSLSIYETLKRLYPSKFGSTSGTKVSAGIDIDKNLSRGHDNLVKQAQAQSDMFRRARAEYLLYR